MESIEQPFDSITRMGTDMADTNDKSGLIETNNRTKHCFNGDSPGAESSPLHHGKMSNSLLHGPQNQGLRVIIVSSVVFAVAVTVALILTIFLEPKQVHGHAAVSCEDVRCSQIGLDILLQGGNAVDSTVATAFCLSVVSPAHSGLGGGGLALVHDHKLEKSFGYNFRETVTAGGAAAAGGGSSQVGIPGFVRGLAEMHKEHGKLVWRELLQPALELAQFGFKISTNLARTLNQVGASVFDKPGLREMFLKDRNHVKDVNDTVICPELAKTLQAIQADPDSFYTNRLIVNDLTSLGGSLTQQDLQNYTVQHVPVLISKFQDLTVIGLPPPASGATVALMLNMIDKLGWQHTQRNENLTYHQLIEVFKFGLAHKSLLGDPDFSLDMQNVTANLTSPWFADQLVKQINDSMTFNNEPSHYGPPTYQPSNSLGMSHISVIDSAELMVSTSLGLNTPFVSNIWLPHTGIWLNSALVDFTSSPNEEKPGKRAMSSASPTIVYNQEHPCAYRLIVGGSSGDRAITGMVESIVNSVIFRMSLVDAVSAPRVHNQLIPAQTLYEEGIPEPVLADLNMKGNTLSKWEISEELSAVMAVLKSNDDIQAYADFRMFSTAAQY